MRCSRKPLFGYKTLIAATIAIAGLSMTVWAHHMFTTGAVLLCRDRTGETGWHAARQRGNR